MNYGKYNDRDLVEMLKAGKREAMPPLYDRYVKMLHYFIIRTAKSKELAEDVVQDVFIKLWENRDKLDPDKPFKSFMFRMTKNHLLNLLHRMQHETRILDEVRRYAVSSAESIDLYMDGAENEAAIREALEKLPPKCKEVFISCKVNGLSYQDTATLLGISVGTVNGHMVKALAYIKKYIALKNALLILVASESFL